MPSNFSHKTASTTPLFEKHLHEINMTFKRSDGKGLTKNQLAGLRYNMIFKRDCKVIFYAHSNNTEGIKEQILLGASPDCTDMMGRSALHIATSRGHIEVVKLLLESGADPNRRDRLYNTPLHLAACIHNFAIISLLLKAGADVRQLDVRGKNPLQLAQGKLQLLQRSWREGLIETIQVRSELESVNA